LPLSALFYRMWRHFLLDDSDTQSARRRRVFCPAPGVNLLAACTFVHFWHDFRSKHMFRRSVASVSFWFRQGSIHRIANREGIRRKTCCNHSDNSWSVWRLPFWSTTVDLSSCRQIMCVWYRNGHLKWYDWFINVNHNETPFGTVRWAETVTLVVQYLQSRCE